MENLQNEKRLKYFNLLLAKNKYYGLNENDL